MSETNTLTKKECEARNAYRREWYAKNKDKAKAYNKRYWAKKAAAQEAKNDE